MPRTSGEVRSPCDVNARILVCPSSPRRDSSRSSTLRNVVPYVGTPPFNGLNQQNPSFPIPFQGAGVSAPLPPLTFATQYDIGTTPYQMQWNTNIQREIVKDTILDGWLRWLARRESALLRDFNPLQVTPDAQGVQHFGSLVKAADGSYSIISNPRLNPNFGTLSLSQPSSTSRYNGLQTSLNRCFGSGLQRYLSYTWSHCTDLADTYGGLGGKNGTSNWNNPYDGTTDKGNCGYDIRHNLTFNAVYKLPFKGNRFVEGWQLSGIETFHTGVPLTVLSYIVGASRQIQFGLKLLF